MGNFQTKNSNQLIEAARSGQTDQVKKLLENGANVDSKDFQSATALMAASEEGHENIVRMLLDAGANVDSKDFQSATALLKASEEGHENIVRMLLDAGANVNYVDYFDQTAIMKASKRGHEKVVKILLEAVAYDRKTIICCPNTVQILLETGMDPNKEDEQGNLLLHSAIPSSNTVTSSQFNLIELLLSYGADPSKKDGKGQDAYWLALKRNQATVYNLFDYHARKKNI